jgi:small subunit ribosomal protein S20
MPNTKSAERRVRSNARKRLHNRSIKSRLKTLERVYEDAVKSGKPDDAGTAYRRLSSAFDKAAKVGVVHKGKADRKKSRLAARLAAAANPAPAKAK